MPLDFGCCCCTHTQHGNTHTHACCVPRTLLVPNGCATLSRQRHAGSGLPKHACALQTFECRSLAHAHPDLPTAHPPVGHRAKLGVQRCPGRGRRGRREDSLQAARGRVRQQRKVLHRVSHGHVRARERACLHGRDHSHPRGTCGVPVSLGARRRLQPMRRQASMCGVAHTRTATPCMHARASLRQRRSSLKGRPARHESGGGGARASSTHAPWTSSAASLFAEHRPAHTHTHTHAHTCAHADAFKQ